MGKTIKKNNWQVERSKESHVQRSVNNAFNSAVRYGFRWVKRDKHVVKQENELLKQEYEIALAEWDEKRSREEARWVSMGVRWNSEWAWMEYNPMPRLYHARIYDMTPFDMTFEEFFEIESKKHVDYYDKIARKGLPESNRKKWFKTLCKKHIRHNNRNNVSKVMQGEDTDDMIWAKKRDTSFYKWVVW